MSEDRRQMRQQFLDVWQKRQQPESLSAFEHQILDVIRTHNEYESIMDDPDVLDKDYETDGNPFLHMSLHLGITEQLTTNRPAGIRDIYQSLLKKYDDDHIVQHLLMNVMAEVIWEAQTKQQVPDDKEYLAKLKKLEVDT